MRTIFTLQEAKSCRGLAKASPCHLGYSSSDHQVMKNRARHGHGGRGSAVTTGGGRSQWGRCGHGGGEALADGGEGGAHTRGEPVEAARPADQDGAPS
jgi:hypothetical protein